MIFLGTPLAILNDVIQGMVNSISPQIIVIPFCSAPIYAW